MKQKAEAVKRCLNLWDNTSAPLKRQRVTGPFFRSAYVKESQTGTLEHGFVEPDANQDTQNATKLRPLLAPICQTTAFPWTTLDERQIKKIFDAWIHHGREPTLEEWEAMVIPGRSLEEMKLRWLRQVLLASKWTSAETKQLKLLGDKRSHDWIVIAHDMSTSKKMRYPMECLVHYQRECNPFITDGDLSKRKRQATKTYAPFVHNCGKDWECKAELIQHRSPEDLEQKRTSIFSSFLYFWLMNSKQLGAGDVEWIRFAWRQPIVGTVSSAFDRSHQDVAADTKWTCRSAAFQILQRKALGQTTLSRQRFNAHRSYDALLAP
ncbi:unnamed protein product [Aphanomyces euteiches]